MTAVSPLSSTLRALPPRPAPAAAERGWDLALRKSAALKTRTLRLMHLIFDVPKIDAKTSARKRIAFIKRGRFSYINVSVGELLQEQFPEYDIEHIDLFEHVLMRNKIAMLANVLHVLRLYGWDIVRRRRTLQNCFYRTPYIFRKIKELIREHLGPRLEGYVFSFQTQSLYDASIEGLPHFVYTDHTHLTNLYYPGFERGQLYAPAWIDLEKDIYRNAQKTFLMSSHVRRSIVEQYAGDASRIACVYAGSNLDDRSLPLENDGYRNKHILFVGVEWERKGGPQLLEAFARVLQRHPDAQLTIVGCSPCVDLPNVHVAGRVPLTQVKQHLVKASVLCLPTRIEPFGIVSIEAAIHKIPVVATRIGALPDVVEEGKSGRLVEVDNVQALADALAELISDPEKCRAFGEHGYRHVKDFYSWHAVGERVRQEIGAAICH